MILADTSIWIEYFRGNAPYHDLMGYQLEEQQIISVEWIFGELLQGAKNFSEAKIIKQFWGNIPHVESEGIVIEAGEYSRQYHLISKGIGLIDTAILLAARKSQAKIWSLDKKLNALLKKEEIFLGVKIN